MKTNGCPRLQGARLSGAVFLAALGVAGMTAASAQEKFKLKIADPFPTSHYVVNEGVKPWIAKAEELSGGRLTFEYYPAQQLGKAKDLLALAQSRVTDIAMIAPAYMPDKLPLSVVGELPGMFTNTCVGSRALAKISQPGQILGQSELKTHGVRVLLPNMLAPYSVMTTQAELKSYKDLAGKKIYASGGAKDALLRAIGAVPIRMTGPELYQGVQRGTLDGTMLAYIGLRPYDLHTLLKSGLDGFSVGSTTVLYVIGDKAWAALPADLQKALVESGNYAAQKLCAYSDEMNGKELATFKAAGMKIHTIAGKEKAELAAKVEPVAAEWATALDRRGRPGTKTLQAYRAALAGEK